VITYPAFRAAVAERDIDELAAAAAVPADAIRAIAAGGVTASFAYRDRLARALDANPIELFRLEPYLEEALAGAPSRYVTDPAVLRLVDQRRVR
jgi:hypothetical protein